MRMCVCVYACAGVCVCVRVHVRAYACSRARVRACALRPRLGGREAAPWPRPAGRKNRNPAARGLGRRDRDGDEKTAKKNGRRRQKIRVVALSVSAVVSTWKCKEFVAYPAWMPESHFHGIFYNLGIAKMPNPNKMYQRECQRPVLNEPQPLFNRRRIARDIA